MPPRVTGTVLLWIVSQKSPRKISRHDKREIRAKPPRLGRLGRWWARQQDRRPTAQREQENAQLSEHVYQQLTTDPEFFRQFL